MYNKIIIFGGHIQALGLARQAKSEGLEVILLIKDKWSVARFSNAVDKTIICKQLELIVTLIQPYAGLETLLFPTSDEYVELLTDNYDTLSKDFSIGIPKPSCTNIFSNKRRTYQFCERYGIPHPKSYYPDTLDDIICLADNITYPIVIKPAVMYSFHEKFGKKAFLCHRSEELISKCKKIQTDGYQIENLVVQEFVSGGAKNLYSFGTYCKNGYPIAWIQANRIRQNPMDFGNSTTFAISCNIPEIEICARKILKEVNYTGLAEVEFMYDVESGQYKFLEINIRAWKWHTLSEAFGYGFLSEMIRNANGRESRFHLSTEKKAWVERLTDFTIILKESFKGKMEPFRAILTYRIPKINAVWNRKDSLPAFMYLIVSPVLFIKRY